MSNKQIWIVYETDDMGFPTDPIMITASVAKVKKFLTKKITNQDVYYQSSDLPVKKQLEQFRFDFQYRNMTYINNNLKGCFYDYHYDGEELI